MSREMLKSLIELLPDEVEAIERANKSIAENGTISHDSVDWD